jgi:hypothetical protein
MCDNIIIEGGYNSSYIDNLFISLFYVETQYDKILNIKCKNPSFEYLKTLIKYKMIEKIKNNFSIETKLINEMRNYCVICGWKKNENMLALYDISDFYSFFAINFSDSLIIYEIEELKDIKKSISFIEIDIIKYSFNKSLTTLVEHWICENFSETNNFYLNNIPLMIPIYLKRLNNNIFDNRQIDIMKKLKIKNNITTWKIHAIICYSEICPRYYSLICNNYKLNQWILYDNTLKPSFVITDIKNNEIANKIKTECVMVFYKL